MAVIFYHNCLLLKSIVQVHEKSKIRLFPYVFISKFVKFNWAKYCGNLSPSIMNNDGSSLDFLYVKWYFLPFLWFSSPFFPLLKRLLNDDEPLSMHIVKSFLYSDLNIKLKPICISTIKQLFLDRRLCGHCSFFDLWGPETPWIYTLLIQCYKKPQNKST